MSKLAKETYKNLKNYNKYNRQKGGYICDVCRYDNDDAENECINCHMARLPDLSREPQPSPLPPLRRAPANPLFNIDINRCQTCRTHECCYRLSPCVNNCDCLLRERMQILHLIQQCMLDPNNEYSQYYGEMVNYIR